jgi:hypothetical protein
VLGQGFPESEQLGFVKYDFLRPAIKMKFADAVAACRILHHHPLVEREEQLVVGFDPHLGLL